MAQSAHPFQMSAYLESQVCLMGQHAPFEEAEHLLKELVGVEVAAKQVERVCLYFGERIAEAIPDAATQIKGERLYAMLDGSMLLTREQGWKEVKLGRLFTEGDRSRGERGRIGPSAYIARLGGKEGFLPEFEQALSRARYEELVVVADGAAWIWDWAQARCPRAVQVLDYYHAKQALWRYAEAHFASQERRLAWLAEQEARLFDDRVGEIIEAVESYGYRSLADLRQRDALVGYFKRNRGRMLYGSYRRRGLMIGSGPVESAHRNVIQQRLKLAGQRWSWRGAQAVANLRVLHKSGHWSALIKETCQLKAAA